MKVFQGKPWPDKVNYVDKNNKVVGYDDSQCCCESFGHGIVESLEQIKAAKNDEILCELIGSKINIDDYVFEGSTPIIINPTNSDTSDVFSVACFKLICPGKVDLWLILWNYHNGYYSHGFVDYDGNKDYL